MSKKTGEISVEKANLQLNTVGLSIVIPVYNEEEMLFKLAERLFPALDKIGRSYEVIFTNDGSKDRSWAVLKELKNKHPKTVSLVDFNGNYGQHMAIIAGFEQARGEIVVTMDADLQNPPEEIHKLVEKMDEGFDVVGSYRANRLNNDNVFRHFGSKIINCFRFLFTDIRMKDQGCMLRAYRPHIIRLIVDTVETSTFIPALAYKLAGNPTEIEVLHEARAEGESKYSIYKLVRVTLDLLMGFSLVPLHIFSIGGMIISFCSMLLCGYLMIRRLIVGPEAEGIFTLFAILYFLVGVCITGIGIVGEYVGRTYQAVCRRPRFLVREVSLRDSSEQ